MINPVFCFVAVFNHPIFYINAASVAFLSNHYPESSSRCRRRGIEGAVSGHLFPSERRCRRRSAPCSLGALFFRRRCVFRSLRMDFTSGSDVRLSHEYAATGVARRRSGAGRRSAAWISANPCPKPASRALKEYRNSTRRHARTRHHPPRRRRAILRRVRGHDDAMKPAANVKMPEQYVASLPGHSGEDNRDGAGHRMSTLFGLHLQVNWTMKSPLTRHRPA
jgi:hypothetical protein